MENESRSASQPKSGLAQRLKEDGRQTLEQRKRSAADRVEEIAQAIGRAGAQFSEQEPAVAEYANRFAASVGNFATRLREGSVDDLLEDTRQFARRNPALFVAGGVAVGFALSRFVKASAHGTLEETHSQYTGEPAPTLTDTVPEDIGATPESAGRSYDTATAARSNGG